MKPDELSKSGSEHGEQRALFAFVAIAELHGFAVAWEWSNGVLSLSQTIDCLASEPCPELKWFHAIPNGGSRGDTVKARAIRGSQLKAEGVKSGIPDTFLPVPYDLWHGLYIEMKRDTSKDRRKGSTFDAQNECLNDLCIAGYVVAICYTWREAAQKLESHIGFARKFREKRSWGQ